MGARAESMTAAEHVAEAERWLWLRTRSQSERDFASPQQCIEIAQVHATLAAALAVTGTGNDRTEV